MPQAIPTQLAPYLQDSLKLTSLTLVTSTLSNPANWLLIRLLQAVFVGADDKDPHPGTTSCFVDAVSSVVFILLIDLLGIDLQSLLKSKSLRYVDGLVSNQANIGSNSNGIALTSITLQAISTALESATAQASPGSAPTSSRPAIIIDGLDLLLAAQPDVDAIALQHFIARIRSQSHALIITANADSPLLHNRHDPATPLERDHAAFVASMAHQSSWVWQLRGLDTGSARDVTGVLRLSKGGAENDTADQGSPLNEAEWLYQVKGDGSVRLWSRGE